MRTKIATAMADGSAGGAAERLAAELTAKLAGAKPELLAVFASTDQPLDAITSDLAARFPETNLIGSSTAGEFTEKGDAKRSTSVFAVAGDYRAFSGIGTGLKQAPEAAIEQALEGLPRELRGFPHRTAILLLDPLAGNGEETTLLAASLLGEDARLVGGAAGDDLQMTRTLVASGRRSASDAVVIALLFSKAPLGVGVCHGHEPLSKPLRITSAAGNVVREIEGRAAWDVWREHTRESAARRGVDVARISKPDEGPFLLRYEAGLAAGESGRNYKIRAPLSRAEDGSMRFACGIPEGAVIRITESEPERQVESAREAARRARAQVGGKAGGALVFDCICRNLILERDFARAVRAMSEELDGAPLAGFETYGEIALDVGDMSGFHNTTSVVLAFPA